MAGSAKVTATPSSTLKTRSIEGCIRTGIWKPTFSAKGIKPALTPSMKNISPTITAKMPSATDSGSSKELRRASA